MEVGNFACILFVIICVTNFSEIEGLRLFFTDFLKKFENMNPLFIGTDDYDLDVKGMFENSNRYRLIRYTTNKEEEQVSRHINHLFIRGDLTMAVFIDKGHHKLLDLLINNLQLFNKGLTGLISEHDIIIHVSLTLRLQTGLYTYTSLKEDTITLKEFYSVSGKKKVHIVGSWKKSTGLVISTTNMWERRINFEGMSIRVATKNFPPMQKLHYDTSKQSITGGEGLFLNPLNILAKKLNFTVIFMSPNDGQWGALTKNGTWTGMIGMLVNQEADIAAADLTVTEARQGAVTFGETIAEEVVTLASGPSGETEANPWIYLEIFPLNAFYLCCGMVIMLTACFYITNYSGIDFLHAQFDSEKFTLMHSFGLSLSFFRQIYYNVNFNCKSSKLLFILSAISTYLLYIHYTAYLTAASTYAKKIEMNSFWDVINGEYEVSVWEGSVFHDMLRYAKPGTAMHDVYHKTMKNRQSAFITTVYDSAVDDVRKLLASKNNLIYGGNFFLKTWFEDIQYLSIQEEIRTPLAWAFPRESELLPLFNYHLYKMKQSGIIDRLQQKFLDEHNSNTVLSQTMVASNSLGYKNVMLPFLAILTGMCVALLQLGIEVLAMIKKDHLSDEQQSEKDMSEEAKEIIDDIHTILLENYDKLGGIKFLSRLRLHYNQLKR